MLFQHNDYEYQGVLSCTVFCDYVIDKYQENNEFDDHGHKSNIHNRNNWNS